MSSAANTSYNAITGGGDIGTGGGGSYKLYVSPIRYNVSDVARPSARPSTSPQAISVTIQRTDGNGAGIKKTGTTWIIIHGRTQSEDQFIGNDGRLANLLGSYDPTKDQVLTVDWRTGANDNDSDVGLQGAAWIPAVGQVVADAICNLTLPTNSVHLIGHSWGSYVAYEVSKKLGQVRSIVALDPAENITGAYVDRDVDFKRYTSRSWAFYGNGLFGSGSNAGKADESFTIDRFSGVGFGTDRPFAQHDAPVAMFTQIVQAFARSSTVTDWRKNFDLKRLIENRGGPWFPNQYLANGNRGSGDFEAVIGATLFGNRSVPLNWTFDNLRFIAFA